MIRIGSVVIDCRDFSKMSVFWQEALQYVRGQEPDPTDPCVILKDKEGKGPNVTIDQMEPLSGQIHLDHYTDDSEGEIKRLLKLGATIYQSHEPGTDFTVLADPEGNLFCVVDKRGL